VSYRHRVASTKKIFNALTRRGPYRVLRGDLAFAGLPGVVYTPEEGLGLPGVAFGHEWVAGADRYEGTLEHLASWGIVAAAPATERGLAPSVLNFAYDLGTTLDIITGVRLGEGRISVHPNKLGVVGHGFGGSAAVFAAAGMPHKPKSVVAIFPTATVPPAEEPASTLSVPGLILSAPGDPMTLRSNAVELARAWKTATLRTVNKPPAGAHRRAAGRRPRHPEGGAGAADRLPAAHADRRQDLPGLLRSARRPAEGPGGGPVRPESRRPGEQGRRAAETLSPLAPNQPVGI
jgi:dienelactone hydrolase